MAVEICCIYISWAIMQTTEPEMYLSKVRHFNILSKSWGILVRVTWEIVNRHLICPPRKFMQVHLPMTTNPNHPSVCPGRPMYTTVCVPKWQLILIILKFLGLFVMFVVVLITDHLVIAPNQSFLDHQTQQIIHNCNFLQDGLGWMVLNTLVPENFTRGMWIYGHTFLMYAWHCLL